MSVEAAALVLAWFAIVLLAFAMAGLLRQVNALKEGRGAPVGLGPGARVSLDSSTIAGRTRVLLFAAPDCSSCHEILEQLPSVLDQSQDDIELSVVVRTHSDGLPVDSRARTLVDPALFTEFHVRLVPVAAAVDASGVVLRTEPVGSPERFQAFLDSLPLPALDGRELP
jgi:hypothetical protein